MKRGLSIFLVLLISLLSNSVFAYPAIISNKGVNHTKAKEVVYSIPESYYKYVKSIEFVNKPLKFNATDGKTIFGEYKVFWNKNHVCYNGRIKVWDFRMKKNLLHELGHIIDHCLNKLNYSTEKFANDFIVK